MAFNWEKFCKAQRDYPKPKFALDAVGKLLKKRPSDPYILAWKASTLLKLDGRAKDALPILTGLCQLQPPITDGNLLPFLYNSILNALRQSDPKALPLSSVGTEGLKAWQNAARVLSTRKARLALWSNLFVVAMKEECWDDVRWVTMQANKEGVEPKHRKAIYYTLILANQLGGETRAGNARVSGKIDQGSQIQLSLAHRQMREAYDNSPKPTDEVIQVASMSDLRFMTAIYERQNRSAELLQAWDKPPPNVQRIVDGAFWDFALLRVEVAQRQKDWHRVESLCYQLIDDTWRSDNPIIGNPSAARANMFDICTMCWTIWDSLLDATNNLYPEDVGKPKIEKLYSEIWQLLPPLEKRAERALSLTQLSLENYIGYPMLDTILRYYFEGYRNPSCFKDVRRFVALLSVEDQRSFQATISKHARDLGTTIKQGGRGEPEGNIKGTIRAWHETETTVLKFELLMIVSLPRTPAPIVLENFVGNALRLWRLQMATDGTDSMCGSDTLFVAIEALIYLFEITSLSQYLYQAASLARYSLSLDIHRYGKNTALLSTRLHLKLGLGTFAFEHYGRAQIKEMLHDNVAWAALSRISQSHPFGANGPRGFSATDELEKVISTLSRMERKIDDLLYADMQHFLYDKAFELLELKRKLRTSLTKQFCIIERRRIARLMGSPVDNTLDLPLRDYEDISDNCDWDAILGLNHTRSGALSHTHFLSPITKSWVHSFSILVDAASGMAFNEAHPGRLTQSYAPLTADSNAENVIAANEEQDIIHFTQTESDLIESFWKPIAFILQTILPSENLSVQLRLKSLGEAFNCMFSQLKIDTDELRQDMLDVNNGSSDRLPHLTENSLHAVYGRLEVLRVLHRLLDLLRPILKARTQKIHKEITVADCDLLQESIIEFHRLHKIRTQAMIDRLNKQGMIHIRAQILYGGSGKAIQETITEETLNIYSKEYVDSAVEALKGVLKVELG